MNSAYIKKLLRKILEIEQTKFPAKVVARTSVSRAGKCKKAEFVHSVDFAEDSRQTFPLGIV
jgi:hypothetical protein